MGQSTMSNAGGRERRFGPICPQFVTLFPVRTVENRRRGRTKFVYSAFAQRRMPGDWYSQNPLKSESGATPCHQPPVRTHRSASSSCV